MGPRGVRRAVLGPSPCRRVALHTAGHARERAASKAQNMSATGWVGPVRETVCRVRAAVRPLRKGQLNLPGNVARCERKARGVVGPSTGECEDLALAASRRSHAFRNGLRYKAV